jgi:type IV secretory pathway TrbD component
MGGMFLVIAWQFKDWVPAIFGVLMIVIGIYAAKTKTGCSYGGGSCSIRN